MTESHTEPTLTLHHLNDSRSQRILWLLEELGIPYNIKSYQRGPDGIAPQELAQIHPFGTAPIITDGEITLAESGAIVEYIIDKYGAGKAQPPESGKLDNLFYTHYSEGTLMPLLVNKLIFSIAPSKAPFFIRPLLRVVFGALQTKLIDPRLAIHSKYIETHLSKGQEWFAGGSEPTSADYMMSFALEAWANGYPAVLGGKTKEYVKRVHARPAYKRALEKGGEYSYAKDNF
ncbi:thioredoxin-like protein [Abortiporus biennis]|nr:thioredoxin-like protein [Abortiporus biennis]